MEVTNQLLIPVTEQSQVGDARRKATRLATSLGFDDVSAAEVSIVTTELATNLIKHTTSGGTLIVQEKRIDRVSCVEILSIDKNPGAQSHEQWIADGFSTTNTLGTGLGAVKRLATNFDIHSDQEHGTAVLARLTHPKVSSAKSFDVGVVNFPKTDELVCGDSWVVVEDGDKAAILVADGLGHGIEANEASQRAISTFIQDPWKAPSESLQLLHTVLRGTRGAAISIVHINRETGTLVFAGLGNVAGVLDNNAERRHLVPDNGTVGYEARKFRNQEFLWNRNSVLILHSDGCSSSWNLNNYPTLKEHTSTLISAVLYRDFSKSYDDVTIVSLKNL